MNLTNAFINNITTRNWAIIINFEKSRHLRNKSNDGVINFFQEVPITEEILNNIHILSHDVKCREMVKEKKFTRAK